MIREPGGLQGPGDTRFEDPAVREEAGALVPDAGRKRRGVVGAAVMGLFLGLALSLTMILGVASVGGAIGPAPATLNILILGTDQRPEQRGLDPGRTDTLMLVSIRRGSHPATGSIALVSIPRDLWVPIPGYGEGRVNTVYRMAELDRRGSGPELAKQTVSDALGVRIDRFVLVDMAGVREVVDQLGGIVVDNPEPIVDEQFPTDDYGTRPLRIPAGRQRLDGEMALAYARTRHQDSDFGRMGRQQQVLAAILAELKNPAAAPKLPNVLAALQRATSTDLRPADYGALTPGVLGLSGDRVRRLVIGPDLVRPIRGADGAALLQPTSELRAAVARFLEADA